jgi:hypothetical protein
MSDQQEVVDALVRYATALDTREWDLLATVFTADAVADYGELGGVNTGLAAITAVVRSLEGFDATQHLLGNFVVEVDGDTATANCYLQAQHVVDGDVFTIGGTYRDRLTRTLAGWRIAHRTLLPTWTAGNPAVLEAAAQTAAASQSYRQSGSEIIRQDM